MKSSSLGFNDKRPPTSKRPLDQPEVSCINRPKGTGVIRVLPSSLPGSTQCYKLCLYFMLFLLLGAGLGGIGYGISEAIRAEKIVTGEQLEPLPSIETPIPIPDIVETPIPDTETPPPLQPCPGCTRRRS